MTTLESIVTSKYRIGRASYRYLFQPFNFMATKTLEYRNKHG